MIRGVNHVGINTVDLDQSLRFYRDLLGFQNAAEEISWRDNAVLDAILGLNRSAARQVMLRAGNCFIELFEFSAPAARASDPLRPCDRGLTHIAIDVEDIDTEYQRLRAAGMKFLCDGPVTMSGVRAIYGEDPEGNLVELIEPQGNHSYSLKQL